jgi:hypothetical protein
MATERTKTTAALPGDPTARPQFLSLAWLRKMLTRAHKTSGIKVVPPSQAAWELSALLSDLLEAGADMQARPQSLAAKAAYDEAAKLVGDRHAQVVAGLVAWEGLQS